MTFSTCELSRLNTSYSYCVSTSSLLYRMFTSTTLLLRMIFNAPFTSAFRTCPLAVLYCPRCILLPLKWYFITVIDWYCILIPESSLWGVRFFRHYKYDAIWFTEIFKLILKHLIWDINKTLIITFTYIGILLKCFVIARNKYSYIIIKTIINHNACSFVNVVIDSIVALTCYCLLGILLT